MFKDKKNSSGRVVDGQIVLYISSRLPAATAREHIEVLTRRLMRQAARAPRPVALPPGLVPSGVTDDAALGALAADLNQRYYQFPMGQVRFKRQRARWGSCSGRTRNIYVSDRLRGGPRELLHYLLVHELCHLQELNHGPRFWALVARGCPDYQQQRRRLREYGRWLEARGE